MQEGAGECRATINWAIFAVLEIPTDLKSCEAYALVLFTLQEYFATKNMIYILL